MASKKMKYASLAGAGLLTMGLVGCASEPQQPLTLGDKMNQSGVQKIENSPVANKCKEYELQKDGSYKCEGNGNSGSNGGVAFVPFWFFNGHTYSTHNAMTSSSDYKSNNLISGTKNSFSKANSNSKSNTNSSKTNLSKTGSSSSKSGGFGSGGRGTSGGS